MVSEDDAMTSHDKKMASEDDAMAVRDKTITSENETIAVRGETITSKDETIAPDGQTMVYNVSVVETEITVQNQILEKRKSFYNSADPIL